MTYFPRSIEKDLMDKLSRPEIQVIHGFRQSGKTALLKRLVQHLEEKKEICFCLNMENPKYTQILNQGPENISDIIGTLHGRKVFLLIDEIQTLEDPVRLMQYIGDDYRGKIKMVATTTDSWCEEEKFKGALTGNKRVYQLQLLNFREFLIFKNVFDLDLVFQEIQLTGKREIPMVYQDRLKSLFHEFIRFGAYPGVVMEENEEEKKNLLQEIFNSLVSGCVETFSIKNKTQFYVLIRHLAEHSGEILKSNEVAKFLDISITACENYLCILEKTGLIRRIRPFAKELKKELTKIPKIYFSDNGLRNVVLNNFSNLEDRLDKDQYFENIVFKLLSNHTQVKTIQFWRTQSKNEVDFVLNGRVALEAKYSSKSFKPLKYRPFLQAYPAIPLNLISFRDHVPSDLSVYDLV